MNFQKIDISGDTNEQQNVIEKEIVKENYNGSARGDAKGWSLTDIIAQFRSTASAPLASCFVSGVTTSGKVVTPVSMLYTLMVRLKVLSRQACCKDKDGKPLSTDPTSKKQVKFGEQPKAGDVVRIKTGPALINKRNGEALTIYQRNYKINNGEALADFTYATVDSDGCITVTAGDAMTLLKAKGKRIVFPEHGIAHSSIKDTDEGAARRITNWLFEEVAADYTTKKKRQPKAEKEAAPTTVAG